MADCACDVTVDQLTPSAPLSHIFLELTPACNNVCPGCGNVFPHHSKPPPLSAADWRAAIDRLLPALERPHLRLTGGEPTLHPEFEQIVAHIDALGVPFTVFTNARWDDPEALIEMLADKQHAEGMLVSVHGARAASHEAFTATPGSFDQAVANARRAAASGLRVCTSTVITRHNCGEMEEVLALSQVIGATRATFSRFIGPPVPYLEPTKPELNNAVGAIEHLMGDGPSQNGNGKAVRYGAPVPHCFTPNRSNGCMAGIVHATVDPWGNLRPCPHVPILAGNLLEQEFEVIWRSETMETWRVGLLAQCDGCSLADVCRSGCQAQAMWHKTMRDPLIRN